MTQFVFYIYHKKRILKRLQFTTCDIMTLITEKAQWYNVNSCKSQCVVFFIPMSLFNMSIGGDNR